MVDAHTLRWQNQTVRADSAVVGVFGLGLLLAWFFFLCLFLRGHGIAEGESGAPPLLRSVLDKGYYAPDLAMILLGFLAFHKQRDLRTKWEWRPAWTTYRRMAAPMAAYLLLSLALFELASTLAGAGVANPWTSLLYGALFRMMVVIVIGAIAVPLILHWAWEGLVDQVYALLCLALVYFGASFYLGVHHVRVLWSVHLPMSFLIGLLSCSLFFRVVQYIVAVRGSMVLIGWVTLLGGSILAGPFFFFLGFVMVTAGAALNERMTPLPGQGAFLAWARTALGVALAAPCVLLAWNGLAAHFHLPLWLELVLLAVLTQALGALIYAIAQAGLGALSRGSASPGVA